MEEQKDSPKCGVVKQRPTATGTVPVVCTKDAGHVKRDDPWHEGMTGLFPLRWTD